MRALTFIFCFFLQSTEVIAATVNGRWHLGIGDPTLFGWITVAVYLAVFARCMYLVNLSKKLGTSFKFWLFLAILLMALGINKQLDLQTWFTQYMRDMALAHGWYGNRRALQQDFIVFLAVAMLVTLLSLRFFLANSWRQHKLTWLGIALLCIFILIRAASFHHFDILIGHPVFGVRVNVILEIGALLLISIGTFYDKTLVRPISGLQYPESEDISVCEVLSEGSDVYCPKCSLKTISHATNEREFKCRGCSNKFTVRVLSA